MTSDLGISEDSLQLQSGLPPLEIMPDCIARKISRHFGRDTPPPPRLYRIFISQKILTNFGRGLPRVGRPQIVNIKS